MTKLTKLKCLIIVNLLLSVISVTKSQSAVSNNELDESIEDHNDGGGDPHPYKVTPTEFEGGLVVGERILRLSDSPFIVRSDIDIEPGSKLVIEPGVTLQFVPMIGITVRGTITAVVSKLSFFV